MSTLNTPCTWRSNAPIRLVAPATAERVRESTIILRAFTCLKSRPRDLRRDIHVQGHRVRGYYAKVNACLSIGAQDVDLVIERVKAPLPSITRRNYFYIITLFASRGYNLSAAAGRNV